MALVPAICTQCGAQIEVDNTHEAGICKFCGTAFITEKVINNYTTNITNNNTFIGATVNITDNRAESIIAILRENLKNGELIDFSRNFDKAKEIDYYHPELWQMGIENLLNKCAPYGDSYFVNLKELTNMFDNLKKRASEQILMDVAANIANYIDYKVNDKAVERGRGRDQLTDYMNKCFQSAKEGRLDESGLNAMNQRIDEYNSKAQNCFEYMQKAFQPLNILITNNVLKGKAYDLYEMAFRKFFVFATKELLMGQKTENVETVKLKAQYLALYDILITYITSEEIKAEFVRKIIEDIPVYEKTAVEENVSSTSTSEGGCYIATCVYGSYDCPQVWTLRRFRDYTLDETWYGRGFIKCYYAISPTLVKWFGKQRWFKSFWKYYLDKVICNLNNRGVEDTQYTDKY